MENSYTTVEERQRKDKQALIIALIGEKSLQAIKWWQQHNHERYGAKARPNPATEIFEGLEPDDPKFQKINDITKRYEDELREELVKEIHGKDQ